MRLAMVRDGASAIPAAIDDDAAVLILPTSAHGWPTTVTAIAGEGPELWRAIRGWLDSGASGADRVPLSSVRLDPPVKPGIVLTIGDNFAPLGSDPADRPPRPLVFAKTGASIVGPDDEITWDPAMTPLVDYEAELAVIIGPPARNVDAGAAWNHVFGYTCLNDVASRDDRFDGDQWLLGKSAASFCPIGPWVVLADDVPDPHDLAVRCHLNGELVQDGSTRQMRYRIPETTAYLSRFYELRPGDVIAMGTPQPTGVSRRPPRLLEDGDEVVVDIERIGRLVNRVVLAVGAPLEDHAPIRPDSLRYRSAEGVDGRLV